ncbi:MAG TPA: PadR family transcriptional regulator [Ktedonobacterales bacterium]
METHEGAEVPDWPRGDRARDTGGADAGAADVADASARRHEVAEYALLGLLRAGPCHGYRLAAAFAPGGWLRPILRLKMSQMYAYLHKLEHQGWLGATTEAGDTPRPRRVFALTPAGERTYDAWASQPVGATRDIRLEFLVKLAFAIQHDSTEAARLVARQRAATQAWLARLRAQAGGTGGAPALAPALSTRDLILGYRVRQSEAVLAWLAEIEGQINRT